MKKIILRTNPGNFWHVADLEIWKDGVVIETIYINKHYEVTPDWVYIYETSGSTGGGFYRGELERKIHIADCEFQKI